jgi:hypothetical protein
MPDAHAIRIRAVVTNHAEQHFVRTDTRAPEAPVAAR